MLPNLGPLELMFIMGIAVLLFGKRLPEVGRALGRGMRDFRSALSSADPREELNEHHVEAPPPPVAAPVAQAPAPPPPAPPAPPAEPSR